ncbi:MAG: PDZ domain-containing protein [Gemmatimonadaceae bacterium]
MHRSSFVLLVLANSSLALAQPAVSPPSPRHVSAPISDVRYTVSFTRATAAERRVRVTMTFAADGTDPILLSLPAWTPGSYEISNFSRWVLDFLATAGDRPLSWDKLDYDTWRIRRDGAATGPVTVTFDYRADTLDNAMAWARPDFLLFNGTNLFMYAEGRGLDFPSRVTVRTESDWTVATSMSRAAGGGGGRANGITFTSTNYHDLVDMPFFVGRFDVDSAQVSGKWMRFATYPAGAVQGATRQQAWDQLKRATPPLVSVFGEAPWDVYTVMQIVDSAYGGASGLEHSSSHVDVLAPPYVGSDFQPSLYAHEIFHAWNVKRLRPADLWPYRYDAPMPTPWLWMSEGITDYYADLALVRGGLVADTGFYALTAGKINETDAAGAIALEDASLNTWVQPVDGTQYIYYPKGSAAGLLIDVMIRDASDNRQSLDHVMRELYTTTFKQGRGFTREDWWNAVTRAAGGRSFADFERKHIDGREPFPWTDILPLGGMRVDVVQAPRIGITTTLDARGVLITEVVPNSTASTAGVQAGDHLLSVNEIPVADQSFGPRFRAMFASAREGQPVKLVVRRGEQSLTLTGPLQLARAGVTVSADPSASPKATRVRSGILRGTTDR